MDHMVYLNKFSILTSLQFYFHQAALWTITVVLRCTPLPLSQWSKLTIEGAFFTFLTIVGCKVIIHKSRGEKFFWNINWDLGWFWASWQYWKKNWADYEQLLKATFEGGFCVRTKKLHKTKIKQDWRYSDPKARNG